MYIITNIILFIILFKIYYLQIKTKLANLEPTTTCPHCGYRWRRLTAGKHFFQLRQIIKQLNGKLLIKKYIVWNTKQLNGEL